MEIKEWTESTITMEERLDGTLMAHFERPERAAPPARIVSPWVPSGEKMIPPPTTTTVGPMTPTALEQAEREFRVAWDPTARKWTVVCNRGSRHEYGDRQQAEAGMRILAILTATHYCNYPRPARPVL